MTFNFGIASEINAEIATVSFLGTILFLIIFDFFTGLLEYSVQDSHIYTKVLHKIYKELMGMGFVSFTLAMYQASNPPKAAQSWIYILDFVGYVIFFIAIFFVAHALYIMAVSIYSSKQYARFHVMSISELLQQVADTSTCWYWNAIYNWRYLPFSYIRNKAEFKIIYVLFRDTYWLPNDFNYGSYVAQCLARYSMRMVNISTSSWGVLAFLCVLNYARLKLGEKYAWNCKDIKDIHRYNGSCSKVQTELFLVCAGFVVFYMCVLYFVGRLYELRLLARAGVTSIEDYETFLIMEENTLLKVDNKRNVEIQVPEASASAKKNRRRMSITTFRKKIDNLRTELPQKNEEHQFYRQLSSMAEPMLHLKSQVSDAEVWKTLAHTGSLVWEKVTGKTAVGKQNGKSKSGLIFCNSSDDDDEDMNGADAGDAVPVPVPRVRRESTLLQEVIGIGDNSKRQRRSSLTLTLSGGPGISRAGSSTSLLANIGAEAAGVSSPGANQSGQINGVISPIITPRTSTALTSDGGINGLYGKKPIGAAHLASQQSLTTIEKFISHKIDKDKVNRRKNSYQDSTGMKLQEDFSDIYFFSSPQLYFKTVEVGILLNSLYLSMWVANFITVVDVEYQNKALWQCAMLLPLVLVMPCIGPIVKVASMLAAIAELDLDVIGAVLEETEDIKQLTTELKEKVQARIQGKLKDQRNVILALFYEIDSDASGSIDKLEFRDMLRALHLHYSDQKFERLYKAVDRDKNGTLSLEELEFILLPEDAEAREKKMRADVVKSQIARYKNKQSSSSSLIARSESSRFSWLRRDSSNQASSDKDKNLQNDFVNPSEVAKPTARLSKMRSESRMSLIGLPFQPFSRGIKTVPTNSANYEIQKSHSGGSGEAHDEGNGQQSDDIVTEDSKDNNDGTLANLTQNQPQQMIFPQRSLTRSRLPSVIEHPVVREDIANIQSNVESSLVTSALDGVPHNLSQPLSGSNSRCSSVSALDSDEAVTSQVSSCERANVSLSSDMAGGLCSGVNGLELSNGTAPITADRAACSDAISSVRTSSRFTEAASVLVDKPAADGEVMPFELIEHEPIEARKTQIEIHSNGPDNKDGLSVNSYTEISDNVSTGASDSHTPLKRALHLTPLTPVSIQHSEVTNFTVNDDLN